MVIREETGMGGLATPEEAKQSEQTKSLPFKSDLEPAKPHVIIFEIIRQAIRNGERFEVDISNTVHPIISYKLSIGDDIDEYIARLVQRGGNDLAEERSETNNEVDADWLDDVLQHYKEYVTGVYQGIVDYDTATAKAAIERKIQKARIDQIMQDSLSFDLCSHIDESEIIKVRDELIAELQHTNGEE